MKQGTSFKMRIESQELLDYPNAWLTRDILSQTGATVLIPAKVPIHKLIDGLNDPGRLIDSLANVGIRTVEIEVPQLDEIDDEDVLLRMAKLDPEVVVIDSAVTREAQHTMDAIFSSANANDEYKVPVDKVENLGRSLMNEITNVSQIAISLVNSSEDTYIQTHAVNVSMLAGYIAKKLAEAGKIDHGLVDKVVLAGLLFDIGKTAIPPEILNKRGQLTQKELGVMRSHVDHSVAMCRDSGVTDKDILEGIYSHHERYNGNGYYKGLVGTQIPMIARILAVADTFDAMTSPRVYRDAVSSKMSFNFIMSANETEFDPDICKIFISSMGVYPPGTVVELSDGRRGTVVGITTGNLLQPKVKLQGEKTVLDLVAERVFIKRSLDDIPRSEEALLLEIDI